MTKRLMVTALLMLLPTLAHAGLVISNVATGAASGSISPSGSVYATAPKVYTMTAGTGYTLDRVTNNGKTVASSQISGSGPWTYTVPLSSSTQTVYVYFKVAAPTNPPQLVARVPANFITGANTPLTISGQQSTILYLQPGTTAKAKWMSVPAAVFNPISSSITNPNSIVTSFTGATIGTYYATLTLTAPGAASSMASFTITVQPPGIIGSNACLDCHAGWPQANAYASSRHAISNVTCQDCHNPTGSDSHPFTASVTVASCSVCHLDSSGNVPDHPLSIGTTTCVTCHDPHSTVGSMTQGPPHYNNITGGMYPASYVTSRATCQDCHYTDTANPTIRHQWYTSGHANVYSLSWIKHDFKTMNGCVQCHTTTGFIAYSTGKVTAAWGLAADKTKEVLTCKGCHKDITTGLVRTATPVRPFADDAYVNRNVGESNICMDCHCGNNNGASITKNVGVADFTQTSFIVPHYLTAGGSLHGKSGYHFPGQAYAFYTSNTHRLLGMGGFNGSGIGGPCVACHKSSVNGHTFKAAVIDLCGNCHKTSLTDTELQAEKAAFANAMDTLKAALADKGYAYQSDYPYFTNNNWGADQLGANTMGAAFNYALLLSEPGAYAHNTAYTKKLITDSIDAAYHDGTVTGNIDAALSHLVSKGVENGGITQEQANNLISYTSNKYCTTCHNPSIEGSHPAHLNAAISCAECHNSSALTDTSLVPGTLTHANGSVNVAFAPDLNGNYNSGVCSALYCHSNGTSLATGQAPVGTVTWGTVGLTCTSCHDNPPAYASGVPKANSHTSHAYPCATCHAGTTSDGISIANKTLHANRAYDVIPTTGVSFTYAFAASGGTCSNISCHHNGTATWGTTLACDGCHDAPPATASHLKHYGGTIAQAKYGDTRSTQDFGASGTTYIFGCGTCHPLDPAKHMDGEVEVEISSKGSPAGSLKFLNRTSARYVAATPALVDSRGYPYSNGTCSNVYCHSYRSWTTPSGVPTPSPNPPLDPLFCKPAVPADLVTTITYKTVTWGGTPLGCAGCHATPPQTTYPENGGAAGDSHSWISDPIFGTTVEFLHNNNMYFETGNSQPISCMYCHNDTVRQQSTYRRMDTPTAIYVNMSSVPINNFSRHVNGTNDVAFEKQIAVPPIVTWTGQKLTNATYDAGTKTCSNVVCHLARTNVKWGTPYKGGVANDCLRCHEPDFYYGNECPDRASELSHAPVISSPPMTLASPGYQYSYAVTAAAPSGEPLTYALTTFPEGMTISPTGVITWTPPAMGNFPVTVRVNNGSLVALQDYSISVQLPAPVITSTPVTTATEGKAYSYRVVATVPSGVPAATYALTTFPTGMVISSTTGAISWTPAADQVGDSQVTAVATAGSYSASQTFTVTTAPSPITITSTPVLTATAGVQYRYTVTASMDGIATGFLFSLPTKPFSSMIIGAATGLITWTPTVAQRGNTYPVVVKASKSGNSKLQSFSITVQ